MDKSFNGRTNKKLMKCRRGLTMELCRALKQFIRLFLTRYILTRMASCALMIKITLMRVLIANGPKQDSSNLTISKIVCLESFRNNHGRFLQTIKCKWPKTCSKLSTCLNPIRLPTLLWPLTSRLIELFQQRH